jgi:hypothetical protein
MACFIAPEEGLNNLAQGFNPISANLMKTSTGRMYFVPEGQHDRSQARSAWESVPQMYRPVGHVMIEGPRIKLALIGLKPWAKPWAQPWANFSCPSGAEDRPETD